MARTTQARQTTPTPTLEQLAERVASLEGWRQTIEQRDRDDERKALEAVGLQPRRT